jgi:hypothetical protein
VHKHLRLPPFTRLRSFMQENDITPFSVYSTGVVCRSTLLALMNGRGAPNLRTMRSLTRHFRKALCRPVSVSELFDIDEDSDEG